MIDIKPNYMIDDEGNKVSVVLPIADYDKILEILEDYYDLRKIQQIKNSGEPLLTEQEALEYLNGK